MRDTRCDYCGVEGARSWQYCQGLRQWACIDCLDKLPGGLYADHKKQAPAIKRDELLRVQRSKQARKNFHGEGTT